MTTVIICLIIIIVFFLIIFILKKNTIDTKNKEDFYEYEKKSSYKAEQNNFYSSESFELEIEDVFSITGRGSVATGLIKSGVIRKGDKVFIKKADGTVLEDTVTGIESLRKLLDTGEAGQNVGLLLKNSKRNDLQKGDKITK